MTKKLSLNEAAKIMRAANFEPQESYPGAGKRWKCICTICQNEVTPRLSTVQNGIGCVYCAGLAKVSEEEAIRILIKAHIRPLVEFPGYRKKWKSRCMVCEREITPTAASVKLRGKGCIYCGHEISATKRKLSQEEAFTLMRANGLEPQEPYQNSNRPWESIHVKCGRKVKPRLSGIRQGESGCMYCSGKVVNQQKAEELLRSYGFIPLESYPGMNKIPWKCRHEKCGNIIYTKYNSIQQGKAGCIHCSPTAKLTNEEAQEFFIERDLLPLEDYESSQVPWKSIHKLCGNTVTPTYASVQQGSSGCSFCAGNKKISTNDAKEFFLSKELTPISKYEGINTPWLSIHTRCGKKVSPRLADVKAGGGGCGYCGGSKVDALDAVNLMKENGYKPLIDYPGADSAWKCLHIKCGNEVSPKYTLIKRGEGGCSYCGGNRPIDGDYAVEFFMSKGFVPQEPFKGVHHPWSSIHKLCGKTISPRFKAVRAGKSGCKYCSGTAVDATDAVAVFESRGIRPIEPFSYTHRPWKSIHLSCGREISPTYADVAHANGGCKFCATKGIDLTKPAHVYLITNEVLGAHKIGISGEKSKRINVHQREGWQVWNTVLFPTGEIAYSIEQKLLTWMREDLDLPPYLSSDVMPQGGWSETCEAEEIDLPTIWAKVAELSSVKRWI